VDHRPNARKREGSASTVDGAHLREPLDDLAHVDPFYEVHVPHHSEQALLISVHDQL
jgi:hypothetical protein